MYLIVALGAVACAIVNYFFKDPIIIAASAFTGSYLFVSGVSFWTKGFPSIVDIYRMIQSGAFEVRNESLYMR